MVDLLGTLPIDQAAVPDIPLPVLVLLATIAPLTPALVLRALVLNGVAGVVFGYLYWRHGLEGRMLGHMAAHLVLQGPGRTLIRNML